MKDKMPTGVEINGKQLRISFMLNGQRCREPLPGIVKINKASIAYADNKRRSIVAEIKEGRFDYAAHFPDSPRAAMFSGHGGPQSRRPLKRAKLAMLYGDLDIYDKDVARNDRVVRKNPRGIRLMDVYQEPLAHVYRQAGRHAKPLTWVRMLIGNCTKGQVVDPFAGTGTTLLACADLDRDCTVYEVSAHAQKRIIERALAHGLELYE